MNVRIVVLRNYEILVVFDFFSSFYFLTTLFFSNLAVANRKVR